jgi:asparagine synthase (glutamine-hydrolysing)
MCGIAGIIGRPDRQRVENMLRATRHRGPDDFGIFEDQYLTLGMNRLSILDTSSLGHQPMTSGNGRYVIVFNGEVYNFQEIASVLKKKGYTFHSHSDTEVVLAAYMEYGEKCLALFRGMFAFVIYDVQTQSVFGARDRFGIKPFYYLNKNGVLVFASELKGIFASGLAKFQVNSSARQSLFLFGSILPRQTMIDDVASVPPGHFFYYRNGSIQTSSYWNLGDVKSIENLGYAEAQELFLVKVKEAVELSFISDRPIGVFLSSGIDSASILATAQLLNKNNVKTFTVGFVDDQHGVYDETAEAGEIARHFGYPNDSVLIDGKDFKMAFDDFVMAIDHPSVDGLNTFLISRYARQHLVVALSGLGGDELMSGYARSRAVYDWSNRANVLPEAMVKMFNYWGKSHAEKLVSGSLVSKILNGVHLSDAVWNYFMIRQINPIDQVNHLLGPHGITRCQWTEMFSIFESYRLPSFSIYNQVAQLELNTYMTNQLLRDMDATSMYNSMEVRFPFLDHPLAEFLFALKDDYKVRQYSSLSDHKEGKFSYAEYGSKRILLDSFKKYLPPHYFEKKKRGFGLPLNAWISQYLQEDILDTLSDKNIETTLPEKGLNFLKDRYLKTGKPDNLLWTVYLYLKWEQAMTNTFRENLP